MGGYASAIMGMLWEMLDLRSGTLIAFVSVWLDRSRIDFAGSTRVATGPSWNFWPENCYRDQ